MPGLVFRVLRQGVGGSILTAITGIVVLANRDGDSVLDIDRDEYHQLGQAQHICLVTINMVSIENIIVVWISKMIFSLTSEKVFL